MLKRVAEAQGGQERYGEQRGETRPDDMADRPQQATAAQMAKRKIAGIKAGRRPRSESPLTNTGSIFEQANQSGLLGTQATQNSSNAMTSKSSFGFGGANGGAPNGTPSFGSGGSSFGFGGGANNNQQPSQPPNNFSFTFTGANSAPANSSFSFGQSQPQNQQTNGITSSSNFTFGQQQSLPNGDAPKGLFGTSQPEQSSKPATSGIFGAGFGSTQQQNQNPTPPTTSFGSQPTQPSTSAPAKKVFEGFGGTQPATNGNTLFNHGPSFTGFGEKKSTESPAPQAVPNSNLFGGFGQKPASGSGKPSESTQADSPAPNGWSSFLNKSSSEEPSKSAETNSFKPSATLFGQPLQTNGDKSTQPDTAAPSIFDGFGKPSTQTPTFKFGTQSGNIAADADASMMSPENTPQKPNNAAPTSSFPFQRPESPAKPSPVAENTDQSITANPGSTMGKGPSLFDRISKEPSTESSVPTPAPSKSIFGTPAHPPSAFAPPKSLYQQTQSTFASSQSIAPPTSTKLQQTPKQSTTPTDVTKDSHYADLRELNESLLAHLGTQDANKDWSSMLQYYLSEAAKAQGKNVPQPVTKSSSDSTSAATATTTPAPAKPSSNLFGAAAAAPPTTTTPGPAKPSNNLFSAAAPSGFGNSIFSKPAETPAQQAKGPSFGLFGQPPATAPVNRKRTIEESADEIEPPATEKRKKVSEQAEYPKLPENASETAKLFQAALDKPAMSGASLFQNSTQKPAFEPSSKLSNPSSSAPPAPSEMSSQSNQSTNSLFAPKAVTDLASKESSSGNASPAPAGFTPTFTPAFTASTTNSGGFLSSFGQKAQANLEKEKKRRRDEDFDSEEENEEEWEKRDAEEQAKKRAEIEAAVKGRSGFSFKPSGGPAAPNVFGGFGNATTTDKSKESTINGAKEQHGEDHTWKQGTPIKFGAGGGTNPAPSTTPAAAPKFSLFGASTPAPSTTSNGASVFASLGKPSSTFTFGQPSNSIDKAVNSNSQIQSEDETGKDGADGDAAPAEPQVEDMSDLLVSEREENDILHHVEKAKARKLEMRPTEGGKEKLTWIDKGVGPIWILRNKTTGKSRILLKVPPFGKAAMNFAVLRGPENMYRHEGMKGKGVIATFIDHFNASESGKPSQWAIIVGKEDDAKAIARVLKEEQKKA